MKKIMYSCLVVMISFIMLSNTNKTKAIGESVVALEMNPADLVFDENGFISENVKYTAIPKYADGSTGRHALPGWSICPGMGADCSYSICYAGLCVGYVDYKGKGRGSIEWEW
jgi:hypothetical protein